MNISIPKPHFLFVIFFLFLISQLSIGQGFNLPSSLNFGGGMDIDQMVSKAKSMGYSSSELKELLGEDQPETPKSVFLKDENQYMSDIDTVKRNLDSADVKAEKKRSEDKKKYFGYDVFKRDNKSYSTSFIGPVTSNYQVGPGDKIELVIWGETELREELQVSRDGTIFIARYGQIPVLGMTIGELEEELTKRLSKIYSGLNPPNRPPDTYLDLTLYNLRGINVYFVGELENPGMYSISPLSTVFNGLFHAGGPTIKGSLRDVQVIRDNKVVAQLDLYNYFLSGKKPGDIRLRNEDIIFVPVRKSSVTLKGEVKTPSIFELKPDESLNDLIYYGGGLEANASLDKVQIERITAGKDRRKTQKRYQVLSVDLGSFKEDSFVVNHTPINDQDIVHIHPIVAQDSIQQMPNGTRFVSVNGHVMKTGYYVLADSMSVKDLLIRAGGLDDPVYLNQAYKVRADIFRYDSGQMDREIVSVKLGEILEDDDQSDPVYLNHRDSVVVYGAEVLHDPDYVQVSGEVRKPGQYELPTNAGVHDILLQAGGFTREAYKYAVEIYRVDPYHQEVDTITDAYKVDISPDMLREYDTKDDFKLQHHDLVVVRKHPEFEYQQVVRLSGEVKFPGEYPILHKQENLHHLVERAGGFTKEAFIPGIRFYREDTTRVIGDFGKVLSRDKKGGFVLKAGDNVHIPEHPGTIEVFGEVNSPGVVHYRKGWGLKKYVEAAGDYSYSALKRKTIVYYPGGNAKRKKCFGLHPSINEGCRIFVPKKADRPPVNIPGLLAELASVGASVATLIYILGR